MSSDYNGNRLIARNTIFLYIRMGVVMLITLYTSRVLLHALGVEDYGVLNLVAGFVSMFSFLNASFVATIQRYYNYELGKNGIKGVNKVYTTSLLIQFVLAVLVVAFAESLGLWYVSNKLVIPPERLSAALILFHSSVVSMFLVILQAPFSSAIMAFEKMDYYAIVGVIEVTLKLAMVFLIKYIPTDKLSAYAILLLCVSIIVFLMYFIYAQKKNLIRCSSFFLEANLFKTMILFTGWSIFGAFAQVARNQGLNIILNLFFGPVVNAARAVSFQIKGALSNFIANISTSVRPQLVSSYAAGNKDRSISLMYSISKINFYMLFVLSLPVALEVDFILKLWLGSVIPDYTNIFSRLVLVIALVDVLNGPVSMILYASGRIGLYNVITSIVGLFVLPLSYCVLSLGYPPYSVYVLSLIVSFLVQIVSVWIMSKKIGIYVSQYLKFVVLPISEVSLCSVPVPLILSLYIANDILRFILVFCSSFICVIITTYLLGLTKPERALCYQFIGSIVSNIKK